MKPRTLSDGLHRYPALYSYVTYVHTYRCELPFKKESIANSLRGEVNACTLLSCFTAYLPARFKLLYDFPRDPGSLSPTLPQSQRCSLRKSNPLACACVSVYVCVFFSSAIADSGSEYGWEAEGPWSALDQSLAVRHSLPPHTS